MKRLNSVCIITRDVRRLREFYEAALQAQAQGDDEYACFAMEGVALSLYTGQGMEQMAPGCMRGAGAGNCVLEFGVEDVDREHERLVQLGIPIVKPPTTQPWGIRSVWFRDPDGNLVNFNAPAAEGCA